MNPRLWTVRTTSFEGMSIAAMHHYVKLRYTGDNGRRVEVEVARVLSEGDANALSELDDLMGRPGAYRPGEPCIRFDREGQATAAAVAVFRHLAGEADCLCASGSPSEAKMNVPFHDVFVGPDEFVAWARPLYERAKAVDWWEGGEDAVMRQVVGEWARGLAERRLIGPTNYDESSQTFQAVVAWNGKAWTVNNMVEL